MNYYYILMIKIPLWAQITGGKGRTILLANAGFFPLLTPVNPLGQRLLQPNHCKVQEHAAGESAELPGLILVQKRAPSTA